jgi:hypothetical protein
MGNASFVLRSASVVLRPSFFVPFFVLSSSFFVLHPTLLGSSWQPGRVETLKSVGGLPPETCNVFRDPVDFEQAASGTYYVFDRRDHAVYSVPATGRDPVKVVDVGGEGGRLLEPTAFDLSRMAPSRLRMRLAARSGCRSSIPAGSGSRAFSCPGGRRRA